VGHAGLPQPLPVRRRRLDSKPLALLHQHDGAAAVVREWQAGDALGEGCGREEDRHCSGAARGFPLPGGGGLGCHPADAWYVN